jgi:O-antigen biosynthesis protein
VTRTLHAPLVSILVVTYRQHQLLARCLDSVERATQGIDTETIVVVNGVPLQPEHRAAEARGATLLRAPVNLGLPGGLHHARAHARGRYLAILQDDVIVDAGWLEPLLAVLESEPSVGAAGSCVAYLDGQDYGDGLLVSRDGAVKLLEPAPRPTPTWAVDATFSAVCLVRSTAWDSVGGPNPRLFPLWNVDVDFGLRLLEGDWTVLMVGSSVVRHQYHGSTTSWLRRYLDGHNRRIVAHDHREFLADRPDGMLDADGVTEWLAHADAEARRRRDAPLPARVARPPIPFEQLVRWARRDARRVRVGLAWFRMRSAIGYRLRVLGRSVRRIGR